MSPQTTLGPVEYVGYEFLPLLMFELLFFSRRVAIPDCPSLCVVVSPYPDVSRC